MKPRWQPGEVKEANPTVLLVEGEDALRDSRHLLLSCISASVQTVDPDIGWLEVHQSTSVGLVVIPVNPACRTEEIACFARRQWPRAKVLLVGKSCEGLQDALYDDIVDACCNPVGFVEVSRRLLGQYLQRDPGTAQIERGRE